MGSKWLKPWMIQDLSDSTPLMIQKALPTLKLPDSRLRDRLRRVVESIQKSPDQSFPQLFSRKADLEGFYRLVNNSRVNFESLLQETSDTILQTVDQQSEETLLAIHDSSTFTFSANEPIEGLGEVINHKQRLYGHFCLGVTLDREIRGVLGLMPWVREADRKKKRTKKELDADPHHERRRWSKLVHQVHVRAQHPKGLIHVADREADDYLTFCGFVDSGIRFVFRAAYDRKVVYNELPDYLFHVAAEAQVMCEREVSICIRKKKILPGRGNTHPERTARIAKLGISAKKIEIPRPKGNSPNPLPATLELNFVRVFELAPPAGESPIEWMLITLEPIETAEDLLQVVDIYRARWVIEEYFKALKTGCAFEKRGLESYSAILNTLALLAPIAAKVYNLKILGRIDPQKSSQCVITQIQIKILSHITSHDEKSLTTLGGAMLAIAALGGHIKYNGPPGWQVLIRGFEKLLQLEQGWIMAQQFIPYSSTHRDM